MKFHKLTLVLTIVLLVVLLDVATKLMVATSMALGEEVPIINGFFNIDHLHNYGAAFGLMSGTTPLLRKLFLYGTNVAALALVSWMLVRNVSSMILDKIGLSLILGGAIANSMNRLYSGHVTDFLHFHWRGRHHFPSFNIADIAICVGVGLVLLIPYVRPPAAKFVSNSRS